MNCGLVGSRNSVAAAKPSSNTPSKVLRASNRPSSFDIVAAVDIRIVDQALPSDGGTWLFKAHAHDDKQLLAKLILQRSQSMGIVQRRLQVMKLSKATDDQPSGHLDRTDMHEFRRANRRQSPEPYRSEEVRQVPEPAWAAAQAPAPCG